MADINLSQLHLNSGLGSPRPESPFRLDGYGKLDESRPASPVRGEPGTPKLAATKAAYSPQWEKEPQIATVSEGLNLALSRLERRGSEDIIVTKLVERKDVPDGTPPARLPVPLSTSKRSLSSMRGTPSSVALNGRKKEAPGKAAARFQKLVFMVAHEMGHTLRMERLFHGSDKLESQCLIIQMVLILSASVLATATAETAWNGQFFVPNSLTLGLQIATSVLTFFSLCVWYREHRLILHLTSVKIHGWLSFPNPVSSAVQITLILLHGPPGTNPIFAILTFFRCLFIFRIFKFHPAVQGIRDSQLAAGTIPSFSPLFYFKTVIRVKPLLAMASILVIALTPVSIAYTFTERYADDPERDTTFVGVAWELIYFAVTQQPPVPAVPSRTLCILASFVASALFTFIFTGMLSALELDAGHSAALKKAFERNLRKNHRDAAAAMIQTHYRAAKQRNPKTEVAASVARQRFKTLSRDLQSYLSEKEGGLNLTSLIYDVNDTCLENSQLLRALTGLVESRTETLETLETENHAAIIEKLDDHTKTLKGFTEAQTTSIVDKEDKSLSSITQHFEATQSLVLEQHATTLGTVNEVVGQLRRENTELHLANQQAIAQVIAQVVAMQTGKPVEKMPIFAPPTRDPAMDSIASALQAQGEMLKQMRKENTELHLANQQAMAQVIATQEKHHTTWQQSFNQQAELLSTFQARQEANEKAIDKLTALEAQHFEEIMQAIRALTAAQAAARAGGGGMSEVDLQQLMAAQAPSGPDPQVLQKLQSCQEEQLAQKQTLGVLTANQEKILGLLGSYQTELKATQSQTASLEEQVGLLLKGQSEQGEAISNLQRTQEASVTAISGLKAEMRGTNDQVYAEMQNVVALLEKPVEHAPPPPAPAPQPAPPPPPVEEERPTIDQYAEVYIPEEQRHYPQYVHDAAQQVEEKKVKPIFTAFALYDLFPIIDRDRSGMLSSNEVRRITFDNEIHTAYKKRELKAWPTEQMNRLQAAVTKLFKGRKIQMNQREFVTSLAFVTMVQ